VTIDTFTVKAKKTFSLKLDNYR